MTIRSHASVSFLTSGVVTLLIAALPGNSVYWGVGLVVLGILVGIAHMIA